MTKQRPLESIPDDELLRELSKRLDRSRRMESELVAHIGEVDRRRLYASHASPSMFSFCVDVLRLSEHEAYLRITAARASREHPILLDMLADGRLHLSGIAKLAPHLTKDNCNELLARATHKTKRQIEELIAELAPKPDAPATMRKLPSPPAKPATENNAPELGPDRVTFLHTPAPEQEVPPPPPADPAPPPPPKVEPLAPARYKIQFTASAELHDKLKRLQALMRSSVPDGDLAAIIDEAVTEKLERLEAKRFAKTKAPRKGQEETDTTPSSRYIPAAVRRAVVERAKTNALSWTNEAAAAPSAIVSSSIIINRTVSAATTAWIMFLCDAVRTTNAKRSATTERR